jgi:long-chain acyl-CoA synthetase
VTDRIDRVALGDVAARGARRSPDKIALVDDGVRLTYRQLDDESNRFAHYLLASGLERGDRVATMCANSYRYVIAMFGIWKAGLVWVPLNVMLLPDDIGYIVDHAEARLAIVDTPFLAAAPIRAVFDRVPSVIVTPLGGVPTGAALEFDAVLAGQPSEEPDVTIGDRDLALIMYTSGTTGRPKGVMHHHLAVTTAALANGADMAWSEDDVSPQLLPLFHCAQHSMLMTVLTANGTAVLLRGFDPAKMLEAMQRERATFVFMLPAMWAAVLDHPARASTDLSSLRMGLYAMAPMAEPLLRRLIAEVCPNFALASGQTEIYPATVVFRPREQLRRFGPYWGTSTPIVETAVMDDEGRLLPRGETGEIVHRGPNVMMGYFKDPEATAEARRFGWHHTGDLGMFDADGQLVFMDRKKDFIKSGGENVVSVKVEAVLLAHPAVATAAVVGLTHPHWGEAVTAFVTCKPGVSVTEDELIALARERLAGFEAPKVVRVIDAMPMTATGKAQKHVLRAQYRDLYAPVGAT